MKGNIEDFNKSLLELGEDIDKAFRKYYKSGYINISSMVGLMEYMKKHVMELAENLEKGEELKFRKIPPGDYIG